MMKNYMLVLTALLAAAPLASFAKVSQLTSSSPSAYGCRS